MALPEVPEKKRDASTFVPPVRESWAARRPARCDACVARFLSALTCRLITSSRADAASTRSRMPWYTAPRCSAMRSVRRAALCDFASSPLIFATSAAWARTFERAFSTSLHVGYSAACAGAATPAISAEVVATAIAMARSRMPRRMRTPSSPAGPE